VELLDRLVEVARVLRAVPRVELARRIEGPAPLVSRLRAEGQRQPVRSEAQRCRLRETIRAIDARMPDGGNCYRRALLEIALDGDAASAPFFIGLVAEGGARSGHAWLGADEGRQRTYDAVIAL
jgi:hypothetical protein